LTTRIRQSVTDHQAGKKRTRISLDMSPELRRRIKVEAAKRDVTVRAYLEDIIERAVLTDEHARTESVVASPIESLLRLRDELVAAHPEIRLGDSTELLRRAREQRARSIDSE
jgi:hypothetical protein